MQAMHILIQAIKRWLRLTIQVHLQQSVEYLVASGNGGKGWHRHTRRYTRIYPKILCKYAESFSSLYYSIYTCTQFSPPYRNNLFRGGSVVYQQVQVTVTRLLMEQESLLSQNGRYFGLDERNYTIMIL